MLGISTNTRLLGMAIINEEGLADYSIRLHKSPWSPSKANLMITSLEPRVRQYCIKTVVLSIPPQHHQTNAFTSLIRALEGYCTQSSIPFLTSPHEALHCFCGNDDRKTKRGVMKALAERYPELRMFYQKEIRNRNKYYVKLFEAVGVATLHSQK